MTKTETPKTKLPTGFSRIVTMTGLTDSIRDLTAMEREYIRLCNKGWTRLTDRERVGRLLTTLVMGQPST